MLRQRGKVHPRRNIGKAHAATVPSNGFSAPDGSADHAVDFSEGRHAAMLVGKRGEGCQLFEKTVICLDRGSLDSTRLACLRVLNAG
jgi:hypothetical protein